MQKVCLSQSIDYTIKENYAAKFDNKKNNLVKIKEDSVLNFKSQFQNKIIRQINQQWFVLKDIETCNQKNVFDTILPSNDNYKLSPVFFSNKTLQSNLIYVFLINVSDSNLFKNDLSLYHQQHVQSSFKKTFLVKAKLLFITDTLINKDYVLSVDIKPNQPKPETVINDYDNSENAINLFFSRFPLITGNGLTASIKENLFDTTDIDFKERYIASNISSDTVSSHATTMATLIAGGGNSFQTGKGIAPAASISSSDFANLLPDDNSYFNKYHISVQNNSYGVGVENFYGNDAAAYDESAIDNPNLLYVFSAGNSGNITPDDGAYKNITNFSNLTGSFKQAKNIITVGSVDSFYKVAALSSKGPAYDGRIKPELVAYGNDGSSGAAAITSGTVLAVQSAFSSVHHDSLPQNALAKAIIINSADDVFNVGPDYYSGFGNVNVTNAVSDALSNRFFTSTIKQNEIKNFTVHVPSNINNLKITLIWNDPANQANAFTALINDLDLSLENANNHSTYLPWILNSNANASTLLNDATRGRDSLNNIEQITLSNLTQGDYVIHVKGYNISTALQNFYVVYRFDTANNFTFISPVNNSHFTAGGNTIFRWHSTFTATKAKLEYSLDKGATWNVISGNINLSKKYFKWIAPDTNVVALARMTINNKNFYSDTFDISRQIFPNVGFNCGDSALIFWNKQRGVNQYKIFNLGDKYLEDFTITGDTSLIIKNSVSKYFAVAPYFDNHAGIKSYTFDYSTQGIACYISNFLADPDGENASLQLFLGTTFNIRSITFQQQIGDIWKNIKTIEPVNNITLHYSSKLQQGINVYRATVTLENGSTIISNEATVYYLSTNQYIILPNPVARSNGFYVLSDNFSSNTIVLFDIVGRKVLQQKITQQHQNFITSNIAKGIYLAVIYDDKNHSIFKSKIIIN